MNYCCDHARQHGITTYYCKNCKMLTCGWHTAIWTDDAGRCPSCFKKVEHLTTEAKPEIIYGDKQPRHKNSSVCMVLDGMYIAGAQRHVLHLCEALAKQQFSCHIVSLLGGGMWFDLFRSHCTSMLVTYGLSENDKRTIFEFISQIKPHIINVHLLDALHSIYSIGFRDYIASIHSFLTKHEMPIPGLTEEALAAAKLILTSSHPIAHQISAMANKTLPPVIVLPNCVDTSKFNSSRTRMTNSSPRHCRIAYVGRLDSDKIDSKMFIDTLRLLKEKDISWSLDIAGDGELRDEILDLILFYELDKNVVFHGFCENVLKIYTNSDIVFFPSANEGLSLAALEAMSIGKVVVATDVGDMAKLSYRGAAHIVPPGDAREAARLIQLSIEDYALRNQIEDQARQIAKQFDIKSWSQQVVTIFNNALK